MTKSELKLELEKWIEKVLDLKDRSEIIPIQEVYEERHYLEIDLRSILQKGFIREE